MGEMLALKETTVTQVGSVRVGCANLWEREYARADGTIVTGMSARVSVGGDVRFVGPGSELVVDGARWAVVSIDKEPGALGLVHIEAVG